jgi:uncharacterized protein YidB (DUF937 family)
MGLLDDLLGGLSGTPVAGGSTDRPAQQPQARPDGSTTGNIMMALLPIVLRILASRGGRGAPSGRGAGGLDDLLGSLLGDSGTGGAGGLGQILSQLQRAGFGEQAQSWVGRGRNMPVPPDAMEQVFGRGGMAEIARRAGISEADANRGLSQLLPEVVDYVTPEGEVPNVDALVASVDALSRRYGLG